MANTIHDYLKEFGDVPFSERPMTEVDSLVLCQLAYLKFDGMVPGVNDNKRSVTLQELAVHPDREKLYKDELYEKDNQALFEALLAGRRFRNLKLNCYINVVEKQWETQFSAITFILEDSTIFVAFRGTDETIVGWKEDFNMAFITPVPGQELSAKYLNVVTTRFSNPFYVGGHSKGGNFAIYSAMQCAPIVQKRIKKVYCMDGPGFHPRTLARCDYDKIADRVVKYMPHSSMVGMIFEWNTDYKVVEARYFGFAQHNPYNWKIENGEFVAAEDIYEKARLKSSSLNEWIVSQDEEHIRLFIDTVYQVIIASQAEDVIAITTDWKRSMFGIIGALKEVDQETVQVLQEIVKDLFELSRIRRKEQFAAAFRKLKIKAKNTKKPSRSLQTKKVPTPPVI